MANTGHSIRYNHLAINGLMVALVLLSLTLFQVGSFHTLHVHVLSDGRVVVHSHVLPDSGSSKSSKSHSHSHKDFAYVSAINKLLHKSILYLPIAHTVAYAFNGIASIAPILYHQHDVLFFDRGRSPPSLTGIFI